MEFETNNRNRVYAGDKQVMKIENNSVGFYIRIGERKSEMFVTDRNINRYPMYKIRNLDPTFQYIEVGAGLGEFIPHLIRKVNNSLKNKPIVIDPFDYVLAGEMLSYAKKNFSLDRKEREKVNELIERCEIVSSSRVIHIPFTLREAIEKHPELIGIADRVIDNYGANFHDIEHLHGKEEAGILEKRLLKPNGKLILGHIL